MLKLCVRCNEEKDLELFTKGKNYKDGRRGTCKKCHTEYMTNYYNTNPDKKAEKIRKNSIYQGNWHKHHISKDKYDELVSLYDGNCHSCKERPAMNIDHDHSCCSTRFSCGKCIRGVLCSQCNTSLGLLLDNKVYILRLLEYINSGL